MVLFTRADAERDRHGDREWSKHSTGLASVVRLDCSRADSAFTVLDEYSDAGTSDARSCAVCDGDVGTILALRIGFTHSESSPVLAEADSGLIGILNAEMRRH